MEKHEDELGADGYYLRAEVFSASEKSIHGMSGNIKKAAAFYKLASELSHPDATYELAKLYYLGDGVSENLKKAVELFEKASELGSILAKFELAEIYYDHPDVKGANKAIILYESLLKNEELKANCLLKLGRICCRGKFGLETDFRKGIIYLEEAAKFGNKNAMMDLAYFYYTGQFVEKDLKKALQYAENAGSDHLLYDEVIEKIREG